MRSIKVNLDKKYSSSYEIHIGRGIADRIALLIAKNHKAGRHVIVTDDNVAPLHGKNFLTVLKNIGLNADIIAFPAGEASKSINTLLDLADKLLKLGADRGTCLIALGGGVVGDMVGFIASIYMRGVPYVQIPTTLVAQVAYRKKSAGNILSAGGGICGFVFSGNAPRQRIRKRPGGNNQIRHY